MDAVERLKSMKEIIDFLLGQIEVKSGVATQGPPAATGTYSFEPQVNGRPNKTNRLPKPAKQTKTPKSGPAVPAAGVAGTIRSHLMKMGLRQSFSSPDIRALFNGPVQSSVLALAMKRFMDDGCIVRTKTGQGRAGSTYQKVKVLEGED